MPKKFFLTYGGPTQNYHNAVKRITNEAFSFNVFDEIVGKTDNDLKNDNEFWSKHGVFCETSKRGYGYWIWKSYVVKKQLESMNENDILVYADAGCMLNIHGKNRLNEYFEMVKNSEYGLVSFQMEHKEQVWTKMDIFHHLKGEHLLETGQLVGGIFIMRKFPYTVDLVNQWYKTCCNYDLISDKPSSIKNHPSFKDNRHDQSIWSLIRKLNGTILLSDETYFSNWMIEGKSYPIWAVRKRSG